MSPPAIRVLLIGLAVYLMIKSATAPKRGAFLTLFGNIRRETQPRAFAICQVVGFALAAVTFLSAFYY